MTTWVALLRAVNVGGTGKLAMTELRDLCTAAGFTDVRTYIQSGNVVLGSELAPDAVRERLERAIEEHVGARVDVMVRSADEVGQIVADNPFPEAPGASVGIALGHRALAADVVAGIATPGGETAVAHGRELYVHYPNGMGRSRLTLPRALGPVTVRNVNTMTRLAAMAGGD